MVDGERGDDVVGVDGCVGAVGDVGVLWCGDDDAVLVGNPIVQRYEFELLGAISRSAPFLQAWSKHLLAAAAGRVAVDLALGGEWSTRGREEVPVGVTSSSALSITTR